MADVSTSTSSGTSWGVPVGAVVAPPQLVQPIRRALMQQGWLKAGKCVSPYQSGSGVKLLAVHLNHRGVCALIRDDMPKELRHLLETGEGGVSFVPGLRLGARIHDGGAEGNREGEWLRLCLQKLRQEGHSREPRVAERLTGAGHRITITPSRIWLLRRKMRRKETLRVHTAEGEGKGGGCGSIKGGGGG